MKYNLLLLFHHVESKEIGYNNIINTSDYENTYCLDHKLVYAVDSLDPDNIDELAERIINKLNFTKRDIMDYNSQILSNYGFAGFISLIVRAPENNEVTIDTPEGNPRVLEISYQESETGKKYHAKKEIDPHCRRLSGNLADSYKIYPTKEVSHHDVYYNDSVSEEQLYDSDLFTKYNNKDTVDYNKFIELLNDSIDKLITNKKLVIMSDLDRENA